MKPKYYRANFLWPHKKGSVNEAGYEFANGNTEEYRKMWWKILIGRIRARVTKKRRKQIVYGPPPSSILERRERNRKLAEKLFPHPLSVYAPKKGTHAKK